MSQAMVLIALFLPSLALAHSRLQMPPNGRIGAEMELGAPHLALLMDYFEIKQNLQSVATQEVVGADFFDTYLSDNPKALSLLPAEARRSLTQGLDLSSRLILTPSILSSVHSAEPLPLPASKKLVQDLVPSSGGVLIPTANFSALQFSQLNERWKALPFEHKNQLATFDGLSLLKRAQIALLPNAEIHLRSQAPRSIKQFFARWTPQKFSTYYEFSHHPDFLVTDAEQFLDDVLFLGKLIGAERLVENPEKSLQRGPAPQYHYSQEGADFQYNAELLNKHFLLQRLQLGILDDITRRGELTVFNPNVTQKGLIRLVSKERIEGRTRNWDLCSELEWVFQTLSGSHGRWMLEIAVYDLLMDPDVWSRLKEMPDALTIFSVELSPSQRTELQQYQAQQQRFVRRVLQHKPAELVPLLAHQSYLVQLYASVELSNVRNLPMGELKDEDLQILVAAYRGLRVDVAENIHEFLIKQKEWPEVFWFAVPSMMNDKNIEVRDRIVRALSTQFEWPETVWSFVPSLMRDLHAGVRRNILATLKNRTMWPESVWSAIPALMMDEHELVRRGVAIVLQAQSLWPESVWLAVPTLLRDPSVFVRSEMVKALKSRLLWPAHIWSIVPALLTDSFTPIRRNIARALQGREIWPEAVWNTAVPLLDDEDALVRHEIEKAIQNQAARNERYQAVSGGTWDRQRSDRCDSILAVDL